MKHTHKRRGIFLITTLFVVMFLTIMGTAVMSEILTGTTSAGGFSNRELALQAAESGLSYLQARLESNSASLAPPPDGAPLNPISPYNTDIVVTGCEIHELGYNVVGLLTDQNVEAGNGQMRIMFRASFNKSYTALSTDANWPAVAAGLPALPYVSASGLRQAPGGQAPSTFDSGVAFHVVQPQMADVLVQGLVVRTDGKILASRMIEGMFRVNDVGGLGDAPINAAGDVNLFLNGAAGASSVTVGQQNFTGGAPNGIGTEGNINIIAPDPASGTSNPPPDYSSGSKAVLTNTSSRTFSYGQGSMSVNNNASITWTGMPTNFSTNTSMVQQLSSYAPPTISSVPALSPTAANVNAGTYVVYNNEFYHFPVAYQATNADGTIMTAEQQPITVVAGVPNYNGLAPDGPPTASLETSGATSYNATTSTLSISSDLAIQPITAGGSTLGSVGIVQAPATVTGGSATAIQLSLGTATSGAVQVRATDAITVSGNVTGTGSLVIGAEGATPAVVSTTSNITVTGQSQLQSGNTTGIALYATNNVNMAAVDPAQTPYGVPPAATAVAAPNGGTVLAAVIAYLESIGSADPSNPVSQNGANTNINISALMSYDLSADLSAYPPSPALSAQLGLVTSNGGDVLQNYMTNTAGVLVSPYNTGANGAQAYTQDLLAAYEDGASSNYKLGLSDLLNMAAGNNWLSIPAPGGPGTGQGPTGAAFNESFTGLVYAYNNFNVFNGNQLTMTGALVTYGGNPASPGTQQTDQHDVGSVDVQASSMQFVFDPTRLGIFANFFGGEVSLSTQAVTVF